MGHYIIWIIPPVYLILIILIVVYWSKTFYDMSIAHHYQFVEQSFDHTKLGGSLKKNREVAYKRLHEDIKYSKKANRTFILNTTFIGALNSVIGVGALVLLRAHKSGMDINELLTLIKDCYASLFDKLTFDLLILAGKSTSFEPQSIPERAVFFLLVFSTVLILAGLINKMLSNAKSYLFAKLFPVSILRAAKSIRERRQPTTDNTATANRRRRWTLIAKHVLGFSENAWGIKIESDPY